VQTRKLLTPPALVLSLLLGSCGNWNIKSGTSGIAESSSGQIDNDTGDIIRQEEDEDGRMRDCTVGESSERRDLPSCNDIVNRREAKGDQDSQISDNLLANKLAGSQLFILPNGGKIRIKTSTKYNDETSEGRGGGELIINAIVEKVNATDAVFEKLFIDKGARIEIVFVDGDDSELLTPLNIPLNISEGQSKNIRYRKKFGQTTSQVVAIAIQSRVPIASIREYKQIARLEVGFKPN
jgi:hypothetical protein